MTLGLDLSPIAEQNSGLGLDLSDTNRSFFEGIKNKLPVLPSVALESAKQLIQLPAKTREEIINKVTQEAETTTTPYLTALKGAAITTGLRALPLTPKEMAVQAALMIGVPPTMEALVSKFPVLGRAVSSFFAKRATVPRSPAIFPEPSTTSPELSTITPVEPSLAVSPEISNESKLTPEMAVKQRNSGEWDNYLLSNRTDPDFVADAYGKGTKYEVHEPKGDMVTVYRAVPNNVDSIQPGDYVSASKKYVEDHLENHISGKLVENPNLISGGKIISAEIPKSDLGLSGANELVWIPKELPTPILEKVSLKQPQEGLGLNLTEPKMKTGITSGISNEFKEFFKDKPEQLETGKEALRINKQMGNLIRTEQVQVESIPILKDYGFNNADKDVVANLLEETATFGGKTLNFLSQVKKSFSESQLQEVPEVPKTGWDTFVNTVYSAPGKIVNLWRASLISQLKTAIRNFTVFSGRFSLKVLDDALTGSAEVALGKKLPNQAFSPVMEDFFSIMRKLTPDGRKRLTDILESEPIMKGRLYNAPIADVTLGSKYANLLNTFNRTQEFFTRDLAFDAELSGLLGRAGVKTLAELPEKTQTQFLKNAVDTALNMTLSNSPKLGFTKLMVKAINDYPFLAVLTYPFPRFMENSLRTMYEFSPFGVTRFLSPSVRAAITSGDTRAAYSVVSKAALGSAMFTSAIWIRNSKYAGEKWYEIKPNPDQEPNKVIDTRPFNPILPTYLFIAEAMKDPSKMENRDWLEGALGINRIAGTTLFMTSLLSGMGPDNLKDAIRQLTTEFLGGFTVPFRTVKDFVAHYSREEGIERLKPEEDILSAAKANLPIISQTLPVAFRATRAEPKSQESPAAEQLTGIRQTTKNEVEKELDRIGIKSKEINPKTGVQEADNEIRRLMGSKIEQFIIPIIQNEKYRQLPDAIKKEILKQQIGLLRGEAIKYIFQNRSDLLKQRAKNMLPEELQKMFEEGRFGELGVLPHERQRQLERLALPE